MGTERAVQRGGCRCAKRSASVNQGARDLYYTKVQGLIALLNKDVSEEQPKLYVPDLKFRRGIGAYRDKRHSVTGEALDEDAYTRHLEEKLPTQKTGKSCGRLRERRIGSRQTEE